MTRLLEDQLSTTQLLETLASERRRTVLSYLLACSAERIHREAIVDGLLEREPCEPGPATHRERLEIDLHHVHLPKLADADIIEYDPTSGAVVYRASSDLESLLARTFAESNY